MKAESISPINPLTFIWSKYPSSFCLIGICSPRWREAFHAANADFIFHIQQSLENSGMCCKSQLQLIRHFIIKESVDLAKTLISYNIPTLNFNIFICRVRLKFVIVSMKIILENWKISHVMKQRVYRIRVGELEI